MGLLVTGAEGRQLLHDDNGQGQAVLACFGQEPQED